MASVFVQADPLLRQVGMVTLYYHLFRLAHHEGWVGQITRAKLSHFDKQRASNRILFEIGAAEGIDRDLIEFDSYSQSPNDAGAVKFRLEVLLDKVFSREYQPEP